MKLILGNSITILIREEDFNEVTVGQQDVVYLRPNGSRAVIKFPEGALGLKNNNDGANQKNEKKAEKIAAIELSRQKRREIWAQEQSQRYAELGQRQEEDLRELETKMEKINADLKDGLVIFETSRQNDIQKFEELVKLNETLGTKIQQLNKSFHTHLEISSANTRDIEDSFQDVFDQIYRIDPSLESTNEKSKPKWKRDRYKYK